MKRKNLLSLVMVLLAATSFGCRDTTAPRSDTVVATASQEARNDYRDIAERLAQQKAKADDAYAKNRATEERQRIVDTLRAAAARWDEVLNEVSRTPRNEIVTSIKKLQAIKADTEAAEVGECTDKARMTLLSSMTTTLEALAMFQKETGVITEPTNQKLLLGVETLADAKRGIDGCLPK